MEKADFDRINYTDVAYRTKEELAKLESEGYIAFEKKQRDSFTKGKTTKPEHVEFLAKLNEKDPAAFDALKNLLVGIYQESKMTNKSVYLNGLLE